MLPKKIEKLNSLLQKLPGIGPKTGLSLSLFLTQNAEAKWLKELAEVLLQLRNLSKCKKCHYMTDPGEDLCLICKNINRQQKICCVVPTESVFINLSQNLDFDVVFFISGTLESMQSIDLSQTNIGHFLDRVSRKEFDEVILTSSENQETYLFLLQALSVQLEMGNLKKISTLARGLPAGAALENTDTLTLSMSVINRICLKEFVPSPD